MTTEELLAELEAAGLELERAQRQRDEAMRRVERLLVAAVGAGAKVAPAARAGRVSRPTAHKMLAATQKAPDPSEVEGPGA